MQYGQIVFLLFVALLFYYAALIVMDIQRAKAAQAAEQDNHSEEDIDISDEAQTFKPFKISRDEPENRQTVRMINLNKIKLPTLKRFHNIPVIVKPS